MRFDFYLIHIGFFEVIINYMMECVAVCLTPAFRTQLVIDIDGIPCKAWRHHLIDSIWKVDNVNKYIIRHCSFLSSS